MTNKKGDGGLLFHHHCLRPRLRRLEVSPLSTRIVLLRSLLLRLREQQVGVLGHKGVAEEVELVGLAESHQGFFEEDAGVVIVEKRGALVAAEGDEVIAALSLVALQVAGHEGIVTPGTLYPTHPQRTRMNGTRLSATTPLLAQHHDLIIDLI